MKALAQLLFVSTILFSCGNNNHAKNDKAYFDTDISSEALKQKGQVLFTANCKACHSLNKNNPTGLAPVLDSVKYNWPDQNILARYIKNAPDMMQATAHSRKVYSEWKDKSQMPPYGGLDTQEIECIIQFIYQY